MRWSSALAAACVRDYMKCAAPWKSPLPIFAAKKRKPATPAHDPFSRGGLPITKKNLATALLFCLLVLTRSLCAQIPTPSGDASGNFPGSVHGEISIRQQAQG